MTNYREFYKEHTADAIIAELERLALSLSDSVTRAEKAENSAQLRLEYISKADARLAAVLCKVREIHETMKRGPGTGDHGLEGNLRCIMDGVLAAREHQAEHAKEAQFVRDCAKRAGIINAEHLTVEEAADSMEALAATLRTDSTAYAEQLKQERDDLKADYLRRHNDAADRYEAMQVVRGLLLAHRKMVRNPGLTEPDIDVCAACGRHEGHGPVCTVGASLAALDAALSIPSAGKFAAVGEVFEKMSEDTKDATARVERAVLGVGNPDDEPRGTFACPICGVGEPHAHSDAQEAAYREEQLAGRFPSKDGWHRSELKQPEKSGWYLCREVTIPRDQYGEMGGVFSPNPRASQLSWFLWVRGGGERHENPPEVLYYDSLDRRWRLRNLLGDAIYSGAESRREVAAVPKFWRELPSQGNPQ